MVTVIATAFNEPRHNSPFVESMLSQKDTKWNALIYHNGPNQEMKEWIESYKDHRLSYKESQINTGQWGTVNRHDAVKNIIKTSYCINSSIQDYYLPNAIQEINNVLESKPDLVHWQAINHLFRYSVLNGEIAWGHIDWGQFCVKTEYIKNTGIVKADNFSGDWHTLQAIIQKGYIRKINKIDKILCIHN